MPPPILHGCGGQGQPACPPVVAVVHVPNASIVAAYQALSQDEIAVAVEELAAEAGAAAAAATAAAESTTTSTTAETE